VAYRRLRQLIVDGTLAPGQRIFENELADQLGISRTPLREALRQLETQGLVHMHARRGAIIAPLSAADLHEEFLIRASLEGLAIELAAPQLTADDFRELERQLARMADSVTRGQRAVFLEHRRLFHQTIFDVCGAPRLGRLLANLLEAAERYEHLEPSRVSCRRESWHTTPSCWICCARAMVGTPEHPRAAWRTARGHPAAAGRTGERRVSQLRDSTADACQPLCIQYAAYRYPPGRGLGEMFTQAEERDPPCPSVRGANAPS
jgi:DNA-binding GntR family transcriptional regulator